MKSKGEATSKLGFLTRRQVEVLILRSMGRSLREIATIIGVSHQSIAMMERRALENVAKARRTLLVYELITAPVKVILREGVRHVDIPALIIDQADRAGVLIKGDIGLMLKTIWRGARGCIEKKVVKKPILVLVDRSGELKVYPLDDVRDIVDDLEKIGVRIHDIYK